MEMMTKVIEQMLRDTTKTKKGPMWIKNCHVTRVIHSNKSSKLIGKKRAAVIWGCVAQLIESGGHKNKDMAITEEQSAMLVTNSRAELGEIPRGRAHRTEMKGTVKAWIEENEEEIAPGVYAVRPGKLNQLKAAKKKTAKARGGPTAIIATIVELASEGTATLQQTPNKTHRRGKWVNWIEDTVEWMVQNRWIEDSEADEMIRKAKVTREKYTTTTKPTLLALNLGEGWRSVGRAIANLIPGAHIAGADRRGRTYTGTLHGTITAELKHDWANQTTDLITALSKKASISPKAWDLITMEMECTLFSRANIINQATGSAHGLWALTPLNRANAAPGRVEEEEELYKLAVEAVETQVDSLERHPEIPFLVENPAQSGLWDLEAITQAVSRNPDWRVVRVDRCAYGRLEQKGTKFLTNVDWQPVGRTGNGRCGKGCTGTRTASGKTKHQCQTMANSSDRQVRRGDKVNGTRYELTRDAVVNAIEEERLEEFFRTFWTMK